MPRRTRRTAVAAARLVSTPSRDVTPSRRGPTDANSQSPPGDPALAPCKIWLARHLEGERLTRRWQELETYLIREHDWFRLGRRRQATIREGAELLALGHRLRDIQHLNSELIAALPHVRATTVQGLAAKLEVAATHIRPEDSRDAHELVQSILHDLIEMQRLAGPS